ncbi:MAG: hypothetical protein QE265_04840 [Rhodoferax sp.]|nr:hypothetical protein [Rhodoferax sp.]
MQPATTPRAVRARTKAPAPFSATAAKLINQILAEAREQLLTELSANDSIIVLHGFDATTKRVSSNGEFLYAHDDKGNQLAMYRRHTYPELWNDMPHMRLHWHPARWNGTETFVDTQGRKWARDTGFMVCDDFGQLVQVGE